MTYASDDLATVLVAPDREHTGYGQAIIRTWDPDTFRGTVEYRGTTLTDLPCLDRIGGLTYQPGDIVLLMRWTPTGSGLSSYWIAGSPVVPGTGASEQAIAFLRSNLAREISADVFADRIHFAEVATFESRTNLLFGDLATPGPTVSNVEISAAGTAIVLVGASILAEVGASDDAGGIMSVQVSGATSLLPTEDDSFQVRGGNSLPPGVAHYLGARASSARIISGLNPGAHTFQAKYRSYTTTRPGNFAFRTLIVIAL